MALGSPDAPVTLVEYADLQCPYCAQWARETLPTLVDEYVETGKLRIVFHGLAFIGPDSDKALRTAIAAGQDEPPLGPRPRPLPSQGAENSGWVTDELVGEIAAGVPGLDGDTLLTARWGELGRAGAERARPQPSAPACTARRPSRSARRRPARARRRSARSGPRGSVPAIEAVLAG